MVALLGMIVSYAVLGGMPEADLFAAMRGSIEKTAAWFGGPGAVNRTLTRRVNRSLTAIAAIA